ncbi:hypothetical protein ACFY2J_34230 [Streptomyces collinus]|uniref:hypothetical protein n=1 Tax=Streptomyces collinus TaxID=42684 RepID=UPI0036794FC8
MPDLPYPHHRLQADGPDETGFALVVHIEEGGGGPLAGMTTQSVLDHLRAHLAGDDDAVTTSLTRYEVTTTDTP